MTQIVRETRDESTVRTMPADSASDNTHRTSANPGVEVIRGSTDIPIYVEYSTSPKVSTVISKELRALSVSKLCTNRKYTM